MANSIKIALVVLLLGSWLSGCKTDVEKYKPRWDANREGEIPLAKLSGLFVDIEAKAGGDCLSWATACNAVQDAINMSKGEAIYVAAGTYPSPKIEIKNKRDVLLIGGYKAGEIYEKKRLEIKKGEWAVFDGEEKAGSLVTITGASENIYFAGGFKFIRAQDAPAVMIQGTAAQRVKNITIAHSRFENNTNMLTEGGGIFAQFADKLNIDQVDAEGNKATHWNKGRGGFLYAVIISELKVSGGWWHKNEAESAGGALYASLVNGAALSPAKMSENTAGQEGGGIYLANLNEGGFLTDADISGNVAKGVGGGIYLSNVTGFSIASTRFFGNTAEVAGGAVHLWYSNVTFSQGDFRKNKALAGNGGAIDSGFGDGLVISDSVFAANEAMAGGAVFVEYSEGQVAVRNSKFERNTAQAHGGAVQLSNLSKAIAGKPPILLTLADNTFMGNESKVGNGGGMFIDKIARSVEFSGKNRFEGNIAGGFGGALALDAKSSADAVFTIGKETVFKSNTAKQNYGGGAIYAVFNSWNIPALGAARLTLLNFYGSYLGNAAGTSTGSKGSIMSFMDRDIEEADLFDPDDPGAAHKLKNWGSFVDIGKINLPTSHENEIYVWE